MNVFGIPYDLMKALVSVAHFCRSGHGGLRPSDASVRYRVTDESVQSGSYLQGGHAAEVLKRVNGLRLEVIETPVVCCYSTPSEPPPQPSISAAAAAVAPVHAHVHRRARAAALIVVPGEEATL